jgi:hypothetical protein
MKHPKRLTAFDTTYYPSDERMILRNNKYYYNTYVPSDLKPLPEENYYVNTKSSEAKSSERREPSCNVSPTDALRAYNFGVKLLPFTYHLEYLFLGDQGNMDLFLKWLAFTIRYPATRIPWAPVIVSDFQGVGKGWLYHLLKVLAGPKNVYRLDPDQLVGNAKNFNEWQGGTVLVLDELSAKYDLYEVMKPIITETDAIINVKFGKKVHREIFMNVLCLTNCRGALKISVYDRRFWVIHIPSTLQSPEYYTTLWSWLRDTDGPRYLLGFLLSIDLRDFVWAKPPPITKAKKMMIEESQSEVETCLRDAHALYDGSLAFDITSIRLVRDFVRNQCSLQELTQNHLNDIGKTLRSLCVGELKCSKYTVPWPAGERRESLILIRNPERWTTADGDDVVRYCLESVVPVIGG